MSAWLNDALQIKENVICVMRAFAMTLYTWCMDVNVADNSGSFG